MPILWHLLDTLRPCFSRNGAESLILREKVFQKVCVTGLTLSGSGKTYTAFQICYRLLKSEMKERILYLADRNILVDQSIEQDFAPLEKTIHKINFGTDDISKIKSYEINFALYHQMVGQNDEEHFRFFPADFFDLIIVDECHRGSAKEDSKWRRVLEYFSSATQIGMTATPKESETISNIDYFGDPIYTYSLKQGIEDGFLAPFKVINITTKTSHVKMTC